MEEQEYENSLPIKDLIVLLISRLRRFAVPYAVKHPLIFFAIVLLICSSILPLIIFLSLYPLALISLFIGIVQEQGLLIVYYIFLKITLVVVLFLILSLGTYFSILTFNIISIFAMSSMMRKIKPKLKM